MPKQDPDDVLTVLFKNHAVPNKAKSLAAGRPIYDDLEVCEIRKPGARDIGIYPALMQSHWITDPHTGEQRIVTYAERFQHQYQQFKMFQNQTKSGTPLSQVPFLTEARRAEFRALNIYTVEQLAAIDGNELKNLGSGGRELKNAALEYIEEGNKAAPNMQLQAELEAMRARNELLEEDLRRLKEKSNGEGEFAEMTDEQVRDYIAANTGKAPHGTLPRKTLLRMAADARRAVGEEAV